MVDDRAVLVLTCAPFLSLGLQSYGGEISLRIYLFALPAASLLAAYLFFPAPQPGRRAWRSLPAVAICALVLVPAFFVARYGNEAFERIPSGELTAFDYLYAHDSAGARLVWLSPEPVSDNTPQMPWESRDIEKIDFIPTLAPRDPASVAGLVATLRALGPGSYLMTTSTQETYLQQEASFPSGWSARFRADMGAAAGVRTVFANGDAVIYTLSWPPGTARQPLNVSAAGSPVRATFWTPVGLVVLGLLLLVLVAREFIRVCLGAPRRLIRPLTLASLPLLMLLLVVVIERFIVLS